MIEYVTLVFTDVFVKYDLPKLKEHDADLSN